MNTPQVPKTLMLTASGQRPLSLLRYAFCRNSVTILAATPLRWLP